MNISRNARFVAVLLATVNWVLPASRVHALEPPTDRLLSVPRTKAAYVNDIALGKGGQLRGYVFDREGQPSDAFHLRVTRNERPAVEVVTDKNGRFHVDGMRGGMFQVAAGKQTYMCRGWAAGTAPPKARDQLLVVPEGVVERGQRPIGDLFVSDPVMVGLIVAAAIAIPIAVYNSKDSSPPGSFISISNICLRLLRSNRGPSSHTSANS